MFYRFSKSIVSSFKKSLEALAHEPGQLIVSVHDEAKLLPERCTIVLVGRVNQIPQSGSENS